MSNNEKKSKYSLFQRIIAIIALLLILFMILGTIITAILGSPLYKGFLFGAIAIPCVFYVIIWIYGIVKKVDNKEDEADSSQ